MTPATPSRLVLVRTVVTRRSPLPCFHRCSVSVPHSSPTARPSVVLATLAAIAIALAVCATAATVIVATDVTRERGSNTAKPQLTVAQARASLETLLSLRGVVDSMAARLGSQAPTDSVTMALSTRLWDTAARHPAWIAVRAGSVPTPAPTGDLASLIEQIRRLRADSATNAAELASVARDTLTPWMAVWRQLANSAPMAAMWGYQKGLPGVSTAADLPIRNYAALRQLYLLNELSGWIALRSGAPGVALLRALENLSASRHFLDAPVLVDVLAGRTIAAAAGRLAGDAARVLGDNQMVTLATELDRIAQPGATGFMALQQAAERDAADPNAPLAFELFDDEKLPFAVRVEILYAVVSGACYHTREVLFGFSPEREARLRALAVRYQSHPTLGPMLGLMPGTARMVRENPMSLLPSTEFPTSGTFDFLLPEGVAARAVVCQRGI